MSLFLSLFCCIALTTAPSNPTPNELINNRQLVDIYKKGRGKRGIKQINKAYQEAINKLQGNILDKKLPFIDYPLRSMLGNTVKSFYRQSYKKFNSIIDNLPPQPSATSPGTTTGVSLAPLTVPTSRTGITTLNTPTVLTPTSIASS